jgi:hypothetical protein
LKLELLRQPNVVGIEEGQIFPSRGLGADIAKASDMTTMLLGKHAQPPLAQSFESGNGLIIGPVVDDDELPVMP